MASGRLLAEEEKGRLQWTATMTGLGEPKDVALSTCLCNWPTTGIPALARGNVRGSWYSYLTARMYLHGMAGALASSQGLMVKICRHVRLKKQ